MGTVLFELELIRTGTGKQLGPDGYIDNEEYTEDLPSTSNKTTIASELQIATTSGAGERRNSHGLKSILLKGQMFFVKDIDSIVFLCSPL